eukprot:scaffold3549_cov110-Skeletonema_dohrnii-CCMP3373.AAC.7
MSPHNAAKEYHENTTHQYFLVGSRSKASTITSSPNLGSDPKKTLGKILIGGIQLVPKLDAWSQSRPHTPGQDLNCRVSPKAAVVDHKDVVIHTSARDKGM